MRNLDGTEFKGQARVTQVVRTRTFANHVLDSSSTAHHPRLRDGLSIRGCEPGSGPDCAHPPQIVHDNPFVDVKPEDEESRVIPFDVRHVLLVKCLSRLAQAAPYFKLTTHVDYQAGIVALDYSLPDYDFQFTVFRDTQGTATAAGYFGKIRTARVKTGRLVVPEIVDNIEHWLMSRLMLIKDEGFERESPKKVKGGWKAQEYRQRANIIIREAQQAV